LPAVVSVIACQENKATTEQQVESPPAASEVEIGKNYSMYDEDSGKHRFLHSFYLVPERKVIFRQNPNIEIRNPKQIRISKTEIPGPDLTYMGSRIIQVCRARAGRNKFEYRMTK
jgi:hypothetical protein